MADEAADVVLSPTSIVSDMGARTVVVPLKVKVVDVKTEYPPAIGEAMAAGASMMTGPLFAKYALPCPDDEFHVELGVPVPPDAAFEPTGRVVESTIPHADAVTSVCTGAWDDLGKAWKAFTVVAKEAAAAAGRAVDPSFIVEAYLTDPSKVDDPSQHKTQLWMPLLPPADASAAAASE